MDRGLNGVQLIICDCRGLIESAAEYLPEARWQRCVNSLLPQCLQPCAGSQGPRRSPHIKAIQAENVVEELKARSEQAAELVEQAVNETLTYAFQTSLAEIRTDTAGADHRDSARNACGRRLPGRSIMLNLAAASSANGGVGLVKAPE